MIFDKQKYEKLKESGNLIFNDELKNKAIKGTNFFNYASLLEDLRTEKIKKLIFESDYNIVDKTELREIKKIKIK